MHDEIIEFRVPRWTGLAILPGALMSAAVALVFDMPFDPDVMLRPMVLGGFVGLLLAVAMMGRFLKRMSTFGVLLQLVVPVVMFTGIAVGGAAAMRAFIGLFSLVLVAFAVRMLVFPPLMLRADADGMTFRQAVWNRQHHVAWSQVDAIDARGAGLGSMLVLTGDRSLWGDAVPLALRSWRHDVVAVIGLPGGPPRAARTAADVQRMHAAMQQAGVTVDAAAPVGSAPDASWPAPGQAGQ